ncbi:MAG TPA: head-tail connector protein [Accumulibacter sp.]|uniref:head-tail connector protein n=1 Tax=Accumulibacter sp. TaxID=2053492 RepID=UPI002CA086CF|nr:head-tail connector protein [Accumulibacter sp.]HNL98397.1 head-tail connector protein [Accumulibacter sp.]
MFLASISPPATEPITLAEAKAHLRVDLTDDDALITALIVAARQYAESETGRSLITQSWRLVLDGFPGGSGPGTAGPIPSLLPGNAILLDQAPVQSITSIQYLDTGGAWQTLPETEWVAELQSAPARITPAFGKTWPAALPQIGSVKVEFVAGYGEDAAVPQGIKIWMLLRLGALYENREEVSAMRQGKIEALPYVDRLLDAYRVPWI